MFDITIDCSRRLVSTKLTGFFTVAEVSAYVAALRTRFAAAKLAGGYLLMIDTTDAVLQSQEVIAAFQHHIATMPKATRIAVLNDSSLARMQVRRVLTQPYTRIVGTRAEALSWLIDAIEPAGEPRAA